MDLGSCGLTDTSPELLLLANCTHLQQLNLGTEFLIAKMEAFRATKNNLDENIFSTIPPNLPSSLESLSISSCNLSKIDNLDHLTKLVFLELRLNQISKIEGLDQLKNLELLNLGYNKIEKMENLDKLIKLKRLSIYSNRIAKIENLENLKQLTTLSLSTNLIPKIENLESVIGLSTLFLGGNAISRIENLDKLTNLRTLGLESNQLTEIENLDSLTNLVGLSLDSNQLTQIQNLDALTQLYRLDLSSNQISKIENIERLSRLRRFNLSNNRITTISLSFVETCTLEYKLDEANSDGLVLFKNPLEEPPPDVLRQGKEFTIEYLKNKNKRPLNECKVILVGRGSVGKTSLQKRIFNDNDFNTGEKETHGIRKQCWENGVRALDGKSIKVHFWDFGGQHIQQTLHQFFYTENTIYILVLDKRKDESPEDFLELIKAYSSNSQVIVVFNNEKKKTEDIVPLEYDLRPSLDSTLLNKYPNIRSRPPS